MYVPLGQAAIVYTPEVQKFIEREAILKAEMTQQATGLRQEYNRAEEFWKQTFDPESGADPADRPLIEENLQTIWEQLGPLEAALADWKTWFRGQISTLQQTIVQRKAEATAAAALTQAERLRTEAEREAAAVQQHKAIQMQVAVQRARGQRQRQQEPNHSLDDL